MSDTKISTGAFIKSKMHNMAVWLDAELHLDVDYTPIVDNCSELELTTMCAMLHTKKDVFMKNDWSALKALAADEPALAHFVSIIDQVRERQWMHEKFWKYVRLFIDVME